MPGLPHHALAVSDPLSCPVSCPLCTWTMTTPHTHLFVLRPAVLLERGSLPLEVSLKTVPFCGDPGETWGPELRLQNSGSLRHTGPKPKLTHPRPTALTDLHNVGRRSVPSHPPPTMFVALMPWQRTVHSLALHDWKGCLTGRGVRLHSDPAR